MVFPLYVKLRRRELCVNEKQELHIRMAIERHEVKNDRCDYPIWSADGFDVVFCMLIEGGRLCSCRVGSLHIV